MKKLQKITFIVSLSLNILVLLILLVLGIKFIYYSNAYPISSGTYKLGYQALKEIHEDQEVEEELDEFKLILNDFNRFLGNDPFDRDLAHKHFDKIENQLVEIHQQVNGRVIEFLAQLPAEERQGFIRKMMRPNFMRNHDIHRERGDRKRNEHND